MVGSGRNLRQCLAAAAFLVVGTVVAAPVAHLGPAGTSAAFLFDWRADSRGTAVTANGRREFSFSQIGAQRVATLDTPYSVNYYSSELFCGEQAEMRQDTLQLAVRMVSGNDRRGTSAVVPLGTITTLTGCMAGHVEVFGDLSDPGQATEHLAFNRLPAMSDLGPGVTLAGPSEDPSNLASFPAVDIVSFQAGAAVFATSGHVVPVAHSGGWMVYSLPSLNRAYARFAVDRRTGAETWIMADWVGGQPDRVVRTSMVKPDPDAGFGGVWRASRMWQSGLGLGTDFPFFIYLYTDGNGERVSKDLVAGTESRTPITWAFNGSAIEQYRSIGGLPGVRTWKPLRNSGKLRFVMEDERRQLSDGSVVPHIKARVNHYVDTGAASPPAPTR